MVNFDTDQVLIDQADKLENSLFKGRIEKLLLGEEPGTQIFEDDLERVIYYDLLKRAIEGLIGTTSAILADLTNKTKNTVNVRLERLFYKHLIRRQQMGNAVIYYIPLYEMLVEILGKELHQKLQPEDTDEFNLAKFMMKYVTDANFIFKEFKAYYSKTKDSAEVKLIDMLKNRDE